MHLCPNAALPCTAKRPLVSVLEGETVGGTGGGLVTVTLTTAESAVPAPQVICWMPLIRLRWYRWSGNYRSSDGGRRSRIISTQVFHFMPVALRADKSIPHQESLRLVRAE